MERRKLEKEEYEWKCIAGQTDVIRLRIFIDWLGPYIELTISTQKMAEQIAVDWKSETKKIKLYIKAVHKE